MATFVPELNPLKNRHGLHAVRIRVIINRKPKRARLNFSIKDTQWDKKKQRVKDNHQHNAIYNQLIRDKLDQAEKYFLSHPHTTSEEVVRVIESVTESLTLQGLLRTESEHHTYFTKMRLLNVANQTEACLGLVGINALSPTLLDKYAAYLKSKGIKPNTIFSHLKTIRTVIRKAVRNGITDNNPFNVYKLKWEKTHKDKLTRDELHKLEIAELTGWQEKARDVFMFCFYTGGTRIGDVLRLTSDNVKDGRLNYKMGKTGTVKNVKLSEKALEIIKKYKVGKKIFPFVKVNERGVDVTIALINKFLKKAAKQIGIEKNLSTHIARHTFADIARKKTGDIYAIQQALGHSSIKVTEGYLRSLDTSTSDNLIDEVNG